MKYSLVVYLKNDCYEITGYSKIPGFEHINEEKLKDIVEFTNEFEHEQELICYLIDEGLLPKKFFKGTLGIQYQKRKNTSPKMLQYGISFKEDKKFYDTIFLKYYYKEKLTNPDFMKLFIEKYYTYLREIPIFRAEMGHIRYGYEFYLRNKYLPDGCERDMATFVEIYCRKKSKDGYYKADFTRIRDLAMFAINYERTYEVEVKKTTEKVFKVKAQNENQALEVITNYVFNNNILDTKDDDVIDFSVQEINEEFEDECEENADECDEKEYECNEKCDCKNCEYYCHICQECTFGE